MDEWEKRMLQNPTIWDQIILQNLVDEWHDAGLITLKSYHQTIHLFLIHLVIYMGIRFNLVLNNYKQVEISVGYRNMSKEIQFING